MILEKDINKFIDNHTKITLYGLDIGGGTPTCLENEAFNHLMIICKKIMNNLELVEDFEPSIEGTFETIDKEKLEKIYNAGFKRISLGIQTMNLDILKKNRIKSSILFSFYSNIIYEGGIICLNKIL